MERNEFFYWVVGKVAGLVLGLVGSLIILLRQGNVMTHRELIQKAMPLCSLTATQWHLITQHVEKIKEQSLLQAVQILISNQTKIEITGNYCDYFADKLDEELPESNKTILIA